MTKSFPIWESISFELGFAATNLLNRHGREFITTDISSPSFGMIKASGCCARTIQLEGRIAW